MLNKLFIVVVLFCSVSLTGQPLDAIRLEVESDINADAFHLETISENGVIIFYESSEVDKEKKRKWYFGLFDTGLNQKWLKFITLSDKIEFVKSLKTDRYLYIFFKDTGRDRSDFGYYEIVKYNIKREEFSKITGSIPAKAQFAGIDIIGTTACLGLNLKKNETDLVFINLIDGELNPVHIDEGIPGIIEYVYADQNSSSFYIALKQNNDRRYISQYLVKYSISGEKISTIKISDIEPLKYFREYQMVGRPGGELLIFGTYDVISDKNPTLKDLEEDFQNRTAGLFFMKILGDKQSKLKYYDFMGFDNISGAIGRTNFVTSRKSEVSDSANRVNHMVSAAFNVSGPEIYKSQKDNYIFSVEVFEPYYKTETRMDYDFYGRPYPYTYNVFSGYNYYDVIIAEISPSGNLNWSNDFPIEDMLTFSKSRKSVVFNDDRFVILAYINNGNVVYQMIDGSSDVDRTKMKIGTEYPQDRVTKEENSHIVHWYNDNFLIYGYQKIKNRTLGDKSTRSVFYANKIAYK